MFFVKNHKNGQKVIKNDHFLTLKPGLKKRQILCKIHFFRFAKIWLENQKTPFFGNFREPPPRVVFAKKTGF